MHIWPMGLRKLAGRHTDQIVPAHLARADEEGLFTISSAYDLSAGEYFIVLGSRWRRLRIRDR
jgi:hypothetical protein